MARKLTFIMSVVAIALAILIAAGVGLCCSDPPIGIEWPELDKGQELSGTVEVKATVKEGTEFASVEFFVDDESIGKDTTEPFSIKWDTTTVIDGEHKVHAVGTDGDGKKVKSKTVTVTVKNNKEQATAQEEASTTEA